MLNFDKDTLREILSELTMFQRVAFTTGCAERLFAVYRLQAELTPGEIVATRSALDQIWDALYSGTIGQHVKYADEGDRFLRGENAEWDVLNPLSDNAIASTIYACQCLESGGVETAIWAATQGYEAADYIAHTLAELKFDDRKNENAILNSVHVQSELKRQHDDLKEVKNLSDRMPELVEIFKKHSIRGSNEFVKCGNGIKGDGYI